MENVLQFDDLAIFESIEDILISGSLPKKVINVKEKVNVSCGLTSTPHDHV